MVQFIDDEEYLSYGILGEGNKLYELNDDNSGYFNTIDIPYDTSNWDYDHPALGLTKVSRWNHTSSNFRPIAGPTRHTFPQDEGWQVGGRLIRLSQLTINYLTKLFSKPSFPPNCEAAWNKIVGFDLPWLEIWASLGTFLTNPKDEYAWLRFLHRRRLYRSDNPGSKCKCCRVRFEHLKHFPFCTGMRALRALVRRCRRAMG